MKRHQADGGRGSGVKELALGDFWIKDRQSKGRGEWGMRKKGGLAKLMLTFWENQFKLQP